MYSSCKLASTDLRQVATTTTLHDQCPAIFETARRFLNLRTPSSPPPSWNYSLQLCFHRIWKKLNMAMNHQTNKKTPLTISGSRQPDQKTKQWITVPPIGVGYVGRGPHITFPDNNWRRAMDQLAGQEFLISSPKLKQKTARTIIVVNWQKTIKKSENECM